MDSATLFQAPRLWPGDTRQHRRATWIELFFDLIFVAAVAEVGSPLSHEYSWTGLARYSFLFVLIWWAWTGHTLFSTRFNSDDLVQRALILVQCFIAALMAANAEGALSSRASAGFGAAYAGMRIVLALQYCRARRIPETRQLTSRYALGFGFAAALWLISALLEAPERYWLWAAALVVDFATPWMAAHHATKTPPDANHFPERFGLFTIILLGEFVASVMRGIKSQEEWSVAAASTAFASVAFAFVLSWWYFDNARGASERHIRNGKHALFFQIWQYAHLPLFLGIGVAGAGFQKAISSTGRELRLEEARLLCGAVAIAMAALATIGATSETGRPRRSLTGYLSPKYAIAASALVLGAYGASIPSVALVLTCLMTCVVQTVLAYRGGGPSRRV